MTTVATYHLFNYFFLVGGSAGCHKYAVEKKHDYVKRVLNNRF